MSKIPDAAALSDAELRAISEQSRRALHQLGPAIQWVQSFEAEDRINCIYIAPDAEMIRVHARLGGFPADRVLDGATIIDPTTAEWNRLSEDAAERSGADPGGQVAGAE